MASFDSFGSGFARGFTGGLEAGSRARARKEEKERRELQQRQQNFQKILADSQKGSEEAFQAHSELLVQMAPVVGDDDPQFQQIKRGAQLALMGHAQVLQDLREQAAEFGIDPAIIAQLPNPEAFVRQRMPLLEAQVATARAQATQEPIQENSFNANVEGFGEVRVTERDTPEGTKFFVDDQEVPGSAISGATQRQTQVNELQIPGLSAEQSGREITALRQQIAAVNSYTELANSLAQQVLDQPEKLGTVGDLIRGFSSLTAQAEGLASVLGITNRFVTDDGQPADIDDFDFGSLAGESQQVKRTLLDLVFLDLASKGQTGRAVSDRDLQIFMDRTGIDSGDPGQVIAGLQQGIQNNRVLLEQNINARTAGIPLDDIVPGGLVDFQDPRSNLLSEADSAVEAAIESGDLDKAEALLDAMQKGDTAKIQELLGGNP